MIGTHVVTLSPLDATGTELVEVAENLFTNPSAELAGGWVTTNPTNFTAAKDPTLAHSGSQSARGTVNVATGVSWTQLGGAGGAQLNIPAPEGSVRSVGFWFYTDTPCQAGPFVQFFDAANVNVASSTPAYTEVGVGWSWVKSEGIVAPPNSVSLRGRLTPRPTGGVGSFPVGYTCNIDDAMCVDGPTCPDYFDGDTADTPTDIYEWNGTPHASTSTHSTVVGTPSTVDVSCLVDQVAIRHGRDDADSQPEASSATLDLALPFDTDTFPGTLEIGAGILVETRAGAATFPRFTGTITDIAYGWEEAGEQTPNRLTGQVIAVGPLADLGRRIVGDIPWPQERDGARVAGIMAAAGEPLDPLYSDPGTVDILGRDVDSQPALDVIHGTAESANGMLWETVTGDVRYADADHRRGISVGLELDACDALVTPMWKRSTEALVNKVSLGYGPTPEEGEQPRYLAERADSIARYGRYEFTTTTELAEAGDAFSLGQLLLTRNSSPVWIMAELPVDMAGLDPARTATLLGLDMHSLVALTGLPSAGSAPTSANLWLEGWTETLAWGVHDITLAVTGYCRTVPAPTWSDVPVENTWDVVSGSWDEASCMGPPVMLGRWNDTPASTRWDLLPVDTTWDGWAHAS